MDKLTTNQQTKLGENLAKVLQLAPNEYGRYALSIGDKTALGLYLTLKRVIEGELL